MGPIGFPEMAFIMMVALLIFGPRKLPELGRTLGKGMAEFRKASTELKRTLNAELIQEEIRQSAEVMRQNDPRRMLRDALDETPDKIGNEPAGSEPTGSEPTEPEPTEPEPDLTLAMDDEAPQAEAAEPESPAGTIARSRRAPSSGLPSS